MKKIVSFGLVFCLCLSLLVSLASCFGGGDKNEWQEYLGAKGWNSSGKQLESKTGTVGGNKDGYQLTGLLRVNGRGYGETLYADMLEKSSNRDATDGIGENDEYRYVDFSVSYSSDNNTLYLEVTGYMYLTESLGNDNNLDWKDGIRFMDSSKFRLEAEFDMTAYFENGTLTLEDASITKDFDLSNVSDDFKGLTGLEDVYSQRNPQWKSQAWNSILNSVNKTLELIDGYMKNNPV